jgi:dTDP-4-dehydrorhamnose reductase
MRLLVTGASGLLGLNLSLFAAREGYEVTGLVNSRGLQGVPFDVRRVDLLDIDSALVVMETSRPEAIVHCAAVANINAAEKQPDLARELNAVVPGRLAAAAGHWGIPYVQISTDAVFDGQRGGYTENDATHPLSVYARSKLAGEQAVQFMNPEAMIVRTVFYGWSLSGTRSLAEFFYNKLYAGEHLQGFSDTLFCPLYVEDLAAIILEMLSCELTGIYNVVAPDNLSKYEFGVRIARLFGFNPDLITPVQAQDLDRGAVRSLNLTLSPERVQDALGHIIPGVDQGLALFYRRWQEGYPYQLQAYAE